MNDDIKLSKLFDAVDHLRTIQTNFRDTGLLAGLEMDVNKDSIVISFAADSDYTVTLSTDYECGVLTGLEIESIEVDSSFGTYTVADTDDNEMLHEAKRLIHDAVYYKLIDEDSEIETNFYDDVYA